METTLHTATLRELITHQIGDIRASKGQPPAPLSDDTVLGEGGLDFDSLDLAVLVAGLEQATGVDPFASEVPRFRTFGEFVALYQR